MRNSGRYVTTRIHLKHKLKAPVAKGKQETKAAADLRPREWEVRGAVLELKSSRALENVVDGPQGTGKTLGILAYLYELMDAYPGIRILMARRSRASMTNTVLVTWENQVVPPGHPMLGGKHREAVRGYKHINGSELVLGSFHTKDAKDKILSSEYDVVYFPEATEQDEADYETALGRLRHGVLPWQMAICDCNPHTPRHWLLQRVNAGKMARFQSKHEHNPRWFDGANWTQDGLEYLSRLDAMTGVRYLRYRLGIWAGAEGVVYDDYLEDRHLLPVGYRIPKSWRRIWAVDFGFTNPFVWHQLAVDEDGRIYREKELYRTRHLLADNVAAILDATEGDPRPEAIVCDHDAQDRAEIEKLLGMPTIPAYKAVRPGIDAVKARLAEQPDGRPRLFLCDGALIHDPDEVLREEKRPTCTEEEFGYYIWHDSSAKDEPVKEHDHGLDTIRYGVAYVDRLGDGHSEPIATFGSISSGFRSYQPR